VRADSSAPGYASLFFFMMEFRAGPIGTSTEKLSAVTPLTIAIYSLLTLEKFFWTADAASAFFPRSIAPDVSRSSLCTGKNFFPVLSRITSILKKNPMDEQNSCFIITIYYRF
jgi:hypothetical protein